ncbi:MAG: hypothetical protein N2589_01680, partial [bacterium]|nr:hypothetical protein [bacterium]
MRKYLFLKLLKKYFLFFLTFFFFTSYITSEFLKKFYFDNLKKDLKDFAFKIKGEIEKKIEKDYSKLIYELKEIDKFTNKRITIINTEGTVIVDSRGDPQFMENHKNRPEFIKAIEKGEGYSLRFSSTLRKYMLYYGYFIKEKGIVLRVSLELEHVNFFLSELKNKFSLLLSLSFFTFFLFFLPFIWISLKDVYIVENFINNLAEGKHEIKLLSLKEKGLERMIENLNKISENLTLVYNEIKLEKDLSEVIDL